MKPGMTIKSDAGELIALIVITFVVGIFLIALAWGGDAEYAGVAALWFFIMGVYAIYPRVARWPGDAP